MINRKTAFATLAGTLLLTTSPAAIAADKTMSSGSTVGTTSKTGVSSIQAEGQVKADTLVGRDVHNTLDEDIGDIEAIILDRNGKASAVIIGVGGFLGIGERDVAVRWDELTFPNNSDKVIVNMTKAQLKAQPAYTFTDGKYRRTAFYDREYKSSYNDKRKARSAAFGPAGEIRATALIGADVVNPQNEEIGEVEEILISKAGKMQVVLSVGGFLGMGEHDVALDWNHLTIDRKKDDPDDLQIRVNMNKDTLKKLPQYNRRK